MDDYMISYYFASSLERLAKSDSRYSEIYYVKADSFQSAYDKTMAYARTKHGYKSRILITAISNLSATSFLSKEFTNGQ